MSRNTLKKHSASSVVEARGCSGGILLRLLNLRLHSRLSRLTTRADSVSLVNPHMLVISLQFLHVAKLVDF